VLSLAVLWLAQRCALPDPVEAKARFLDVPDAGHTTQN
jgi:hypothetical protein